jgi:hypothetical protein
MYCVEQTSGNVHDVVTGRKEVDVGVFVLVRLGNDDNLGDVAAGGIGRF